MGARPLHKIIDTEITDKLTKEILFGSLIAGGEVKVILKDDLLLFEYNL